MSGIVTIRDLNSIGRAGNILFLYCLAKGYAMAIGAELQVPKWFGQEIFVHADEAPISQPHLEQTIVDSDPRCPLGYWFGRRDIDIFVYGQHQRYLDFYSRAQVREWLKLKPEYEAYAPVKNSVYGAAHIRRGDYVTMYAHKYCTISDASYSNAIEQFDIQEPIFRVEEGWKSESQDLSDRGLGWLEDFLFLRNASTLLRANSSFSWWAATLGHGKVYSPVVQDKVGEQTVPFVEGNWPCTAGRCVNQSDLHLRD